jgi:hypothetical protein
MFVEIVPLNEGNGCVIDEIEMPLIDATMTWCQWKERDLEKEMRNVSAA